MPKTATRQSTKSAKKMLARDAGVPEEYLGPSGRFKQGYDARFKADLINSVLKREDPKQVKSFHPRTARTILTKRGWTKFLKAEEAKA